MDAAARRRAPGWAVTGSGIAVLLLALVRPAVGSSHREAPLISEDPVADNTDTYAFVDPNDSSKIDLIANWIPLEEPAGGLNFNKFGDKVLYEIEVDNNGDAEDDVVYQFRFRTVVQNPNTFI